MDVIKIFKLGILIIAGVVMTAMLSAAEPVTPKLTEKLDRLLKKEMRLVQSAMGQIHSAMIMGDHETVAQNARQVHDSFVLQQSLTEQDRKDLMAAVPKGFIELDREFHQLADTLAVAAKENDTAGELGAFNEMTRNCIECHEQYVSDRFPEVTPLTD